MVKVPFIDFQVQVLDYLWCYMSWFLEERNSMVFKMYDFFSSCNRCLCAVSKVAGKGATVVEYLIQLFFKRLDVQAVDNKQVGC